MKEKILDFFKNITKKIRTSSFWKDKLILSFLAINFLLNCILWTIVIFKSRATEIPFYNPVAGSAHYLTPKGKEVYTLPIIGLFISLINLFLAYKVFNREKFLSYLFSGISIFIQIILLATIIVYLLI